MTSRLMQLGRAVGMVVGAPGFITARIIEAAVREDHEWRTFRRHAELLGFDPDQAESAARHEERTTVWCSAAARRSVLYRMLWAHRPQR